MKIIINRHIVPRGYSGITLFPFIFAKNKALAKNPVFINHEKIHLQQQKELLVIFFYFWYAIDFLVKLFIHKNWNTAYQNIIFEREAYNNDHNLNYLKTRKRFAFLKN
ncbi:hypothetical protein [Capnocytophaga sp.]|uniref:hypothetical protein n=1 Tax=Capnocytophaga sp. TaxID=44737 RepID=UPI0026DDAFFB|nr:hypothetical protein [Capnocytophaga sp.]MDO5104979.1 hypothetical protein [Capnocytophaga sp.]